MFSTGYIDKKMKHSGLSNGFIIAALMIRTIGACAAGMDDPAAGSLRWSVDTAHHCLYVYGGGDMPDAQPGGYEEWNEWKDSITTVVLGDSITAVGQWVFSGWGIRSIRLGRMTNTIGAHAFQYCRSLQDVRSTEQVACIGASAFAYCDSLRWPAFSDRLDTIGDYAFERCTALDSLVLTGRMSVVGSSVFAGCSGVTSASFYNAQAQMGRRMFYGCVSLQQVALPKSLQRIPEAAFSGCTALRSISLPQSVGNIDERAFSGCSSMRSIDLPKACRVAPHALDGVPLRRMNRY